RITVGKWIAIRLMLSFDGNNTEVPLPWSCGATFIHKVNDVWHVSDFCWRTEPGYSKWITMNSRVGEACGEHQLALLGYELRLVRRPPRPVCGPSLETRLPFHIQLRRIQVQHGQRLAISAAHDFKRGRRRVRPITRQIRMSVGQTRRRLRRFFTDSSRPVGSLLLRRSARRGQ